MNKNTSDKEDVTAGDEITQVDAAPVDNVNEELEALKAKNEQLSKDYLYLRADYDNYRRQSIKERSDLVKYAGEKLARDILETLDIFETALASEVTPENLKNFVMGIQMTAQQLKAALAKNGITEVSSQGQVFDPVMHEALASEPTDAVPEGHVSKVCKKPYKYHDKVLRTGQVIVAKPTSAE